MSRDQYVRELYGQEDEVLLAVRKEIVERGMPPISVAAEVGKLLAMLVKMTGAKRVLEIGALGGYSGICLARALPADGHLTSLELLPEYAAFSQENLHKAGLGDKADFRVGPALDSLKELARQGARFDFFFIDADKENYLHYLDWAIELGNSGALIVTDNVLWSDRVFDPDNHEASTEAIRAFNARLAQDERLEALILPLADGVALARVK